MRKSVFGLIGLVIVLLFSNVSFAGETTFRLGPKMSTLNSHDISLFGNDLDADSDGYGLGFTGALGYKSGSRNEAGFFGEIESGYSRSDGNLVFNYQGGRESWKTNNIQVQTSMDFVHLFFNFGYEFPLPISIVDGKPIKLSVYSGAGPVFASIQGDAQAPGGGNIQLDDVEGSVALGWQAGADLWATVIPDLEVGIGAAWVDRGEHRTLDSVKYENNSLDAKLQARFWF